MRVLGGRLRFCFRKTSRILSTLAQPSGVGFRESLTQPQFSLRWVLNVFLGPPFRNRLGVKLPRPLVSLPPGSVFILSRCLLFHQTTTIGMLTGMIPVTSGNAFVAGRDVNTDMVSIRHTLGVCPQHDILYPDLTVREHLRMYAVLKAVPKSELQATITVSSCWDTAGCLGSLLNYYTQETFLHFHKVVQRLLLHAQARRW